MNNRKDVIKSNDFKLIKRLLGYSRPYAPQLLLVAFLLFFVTILQLLDPFLIKTVIDDYLSIGNQTYYEYEIDDAPLERAIVFNDKAYMPKIVVSEFGYEEGLPRILTTVDGEYALTNVDDENDRIMMTKAEQDELVQLDRENFKGFYSAGVKRIGIFYLIVIVLIFIVNYAQTMLLTIASQKIIFNMRNDLFSHIQNSAVGYFDSQSIGRLVSRVTSDTESINEFYNEVLISLFSDVFYIIGILLILWTLEPKLAVIVLFLTPLIIIIAVVFRRVIRDLYRKSKEIHSRITAKLNETISGVNIIQVFNKEKQIADEFDEVNHAFYMTSTKEIKAFGILRPSIEMVRALGIAALFYFGGGMVLRNALAFGVLYAFIDYIQKLFRPIIDLTDKYNIMQSAMASAERIFGILDMDYTIENPPVPVEVDDVVGRIEFKNVWFAYDDEDWILRNISFSIEPGQNIAIVGSTGAGKSTIINLITRFYDIQRGEILLDGINIKDYDKYDLRRKVGVVLQDVFLFSGTIEYNINLGNEEISRDEVKELAEYVNASHFIDRLPEKYDNPVVERGATLSSGERQLLSFARTLAYDPKILILDEATSNIDTESELLIQDALKKLTQGRTTISIAHRLSTIQNSDRIIVLSKGVICESGTHQELLEAEGMYYDLYRLQYQE